MAHPIRNNNPQARTGSYSDLKDAMKKMLREKGTLNRVKAQIRAELFSSVDGRSTASDAQSPPPRETLILNELFRDYLKFNGYEQSLSVFNVETSNAQSPELFTREFIAKELGISSAKDDISNGIPLVYALINSYKSVCNMQQALAPMVDRTSDHTDRINNEATTHHELESPGRMNTMDLAMPASPQSDDESIGGYPAMTEILRSC